MLARRVIAFIHCHCETDSALSFCHLQISSTGKSTYSQPEPFFLLTDAPKFLEQPPTPIGSNTPNCCFGTTERRFDKHNAWTRKKKMEMTLEVQGRG